MKSHRRVRPKGRQPRQRFTIAHEIGHFLLHTDEDVHIDEKRPIGRRDDLSSQAVDACEIEANQFAAELLMPESLVREFVRNLGSNHPETSVEEAIEELARAFPREGPLSEPKEATKPAAMSRLVVLPRYSGQSPSQK